MNTKTPNVWPPHDPYSLIAYCANDENIRTVIINGNIVMHDRVFMTLNPEEIFSKVRETVIQLLDRANLEQYKNKINYLK